MKKLVAFALLASLVLGFFATAPASANTNGQRRMVDPTVYGTTVSNLTQAQTDVEIAQVVIVGRIAARTVTAPAKTGRLACTSKMENLVGGFNSICEVR